MGSWQKSDFTWKFIMGMALGCGLGIALSDWLASYVVTIEPSRVDGPLGGFVSVVAALLALRRTCRDE
jgi:Na+/H+-dicarboxylate symporter